MTEVTKFEAGKDWSFEDIDRAYDEIRKIAEDEFKISYYPNQIEIITSEQMLDAYSAVGMPVYYSHWSFGKQFVAESDKYSRGHMGLAYEIVINSNPGIAYLMEENTLMMQCLVMAHACFGHNSFFKNNIHFKQWTDAEGIIDYLSYAKHFIRECEEKYGEQEVEKVLDHAHALRHQGIDRYKRPPQLSKEKLKAREKARIEHEESTFDDMWRTIPTTKNEVVKRKHEKFPKESEENILYFIEKHAPNLEQWKREILRIVRKVAQYFYPQMLTQIMNEGWATFTHYNILEQMYERGLVTDGFMLEFFESHSGVVNQRPMAAINPYALGWAMFKDIKRMCLEPTDEDRRWFPDLCGKEDWLAECQYAAYNFKDESFILQYLSPKVIRDFQLFYMLDDDENPKIQVEAIQNDEGYRIIREKLAEQQNVNNRLPYINVVDVDVRGDRKMILEHTSFKRHLLDEDDTRRTLEHVAALWGYEVEIRSMDPSGEMVERYTFDPNDTDDYED
jgi:stage V sporulation protein R